MLYDAQLEREHTHKLPLPPKALGEKDYSKIFHKVANFVKDPEIVLVGPGRKGNEIDEVEKAFFDLWKTSEGSRLPLFMGVADFGYELRLFNSTEEAQSVLLGSNVTGSACKYHQKDEIESMYCAKAK